MKFIFFIGIILTGRVLFSQAPGIEWQKCLGGTSADNASSIQQTSDGGYILGGRAVSNDGDASGNHGLSDAWVVKLNSSGSITWQKCLGGTKNDYAESIQQTSDGGYIVGGRTGSNDGDVSGNHGNSDDAWVVKLNSSGSISWQKCLGGTNVEWALSVQQTSDGGYIVGGNAASNDGDVSGNHGSDDAWVVKLNSSGSISWQKCLGGINADGAYSIQQTSDGGYIVGGLTNSNDGDASGNHGSSDVWVIKLTSSGQISWQKCLGGTGNDWAYSIQQTSDEGYIVAGETNSNNGDVSGNHGLADAWVVKLNSSGSITWQKCLGGTQADRAQSIWQDSDEGYIVGASAISNNGDVSGNHGSRDAWVVKLNSSGSITWQKCMGGIAWDLSTSIQQTSDGGYITAGETNSNDGDVSGNHGFADAWVIKLGSSACPTFNASGVVTNSTCFGFSNGSINIEPPTNGTPPYTYLWSNGASTEDISNLSAGTYSLTISDGSSCASTFSFTVTSATDINISFTSIPITCYGYANGSLTASSSGGTPGYTYLWTNGANTNTINNIPAGNYSVTVTDANSCTKTSSFILTQPAELITVITSQNVTCQGTSNGVATAFPTGGTPGYNYQWSNGSNTSSISMLPPGTYSITVTDINGCSSTSSTTISEPPLLTLSSTSQNVTCFGAMNGSATVIPTGGSPGYSYLWSNGSNTSTINNLNAGTFTVTVTDVNGCTKTTSVFINEPTDLALILIGNNISCFGSSNGSIHADVSGGVAGYNYLWSNGMTTDSISNLPEGNYGLTITDASGCTKTSAYEVLSPQPLELTINTTDVSIPGGLDGSATAEVYGGSPGYNYQWSTGETSSSIFDLSAGNYSVTVTDDHNCMIVASFYINQPDCGLSVLISIESISCNGSNNGSATAGYSGGSGNPEFEWSNGETTQTISNLSAGTYFVTITVGDCSNFGFAILSDPLVITAQINSIPTVCSDSTGSAQVIANGGTGNLTYIWNTGETTALIDQLGIGTYTITISDANQCMLNQSVMIIAIDTTAPISIQSSDTLYLDETGNVESYEPLGDNFQDNCSAVNFEILNADSLNCLHSDPDTLKVHVTDASGNDSIYSVTITLVDTIPPFIVSCPADVQAGSCQGPIFYQEPSSYDNCQLTSFVQTSGLPSGSEFQIGTTENAWLATDASGNTSSCSFIVTIIEGIGLQTMVQEISCHDQHDGAISIDTINIAPPFSILWSTGDSTSTIKNLAEGNYSVTLTDANGCQALDTFQINNPDNIQVNLIEAQDVSAPDSADGHIVISVSGGTPPYAFMWIQNDSLVSTDQNPTHLTQGKYDLILLDAHHCVFAGLALVIGIINGETILQTPEILIFPNPVRRFLHIVSDHPISGYKIMNIEGRVIRSEHGIDCSDCQVDMSEAIPGVYFMMVYGERKMEMFKFLVTNRG